MTPEKKILLWTVLLLTTLTIKSEELDLNMLLPKAQSPVKKLQSPRGKQTYSGVRMRVASVNVVPTTTNYLYLLPGNVYPQTGEGGFTNTITTFWRVPTVCEVSNGCAHSTEISRFLSCAITIINTNTTQWIGPTATQHPDWFSDTNQNCHPHQHLEGAFSAELKDFSVNVIKSEDDKGFCWRSLTRFFGTNGPLPSACDAPVIQSGWGDTYDAGTLCNGIDVTGVPEGDYNFVVTLDPLHRYGCYQQLQQPIHLSSTNVTKISWPSLSIVDSATYVTVSWSADTSWRLQQSDDMQTWTSAEGFFANQSPRNFPKTQPQQFFRLVK